MQAYGDFVEVTGSLWKLVEASEMIYRKLEVSVECIEVFTTSMEAPTIPVEGSINLNEKKQLNEEKN